MDVAADPDKTYHYYYNEAWQCLEMRLDASTSPKEQYFWGTHYIDALAVRYWDSTGDGDFGDTDEVQYYSHDANYNVTGVYTTAGVAAERYRYTPYGDLLVLAANFANDADGLSDFANATTFTGRLLDTEYGQYYFRNRYYGPGLGRFAARDSIGYADGLNLYAGYFVPNELDPFGFAEELPRVPRKDTPFLNDLFDKDNPAGRLPSSVNDSTIRTYIDRANQKIEFHKARLANPAGLRPAQIEGSRLAIQEQTRRLALLRKQLWGRILGRAASQGIPIAGIILGGVAVRENIYSQTEEYNRHSQINLHVRVNAAHRRAEELTFGHADYVFGELDCPEPNEEAVSECLRGFYDGVQSKVMLELEGISHANINDLVTDLKSCLQAACGQNDGDMRAPAEK